MDDFTNWITPGYTAIALAIAAVFFWQNCAPATRALCTAIGVFGLTKLSGRVADLLNSGGNSVAGFFADITGKLFDSRIGAIAPALLAFAAVLAFYLEVAPAKWKFSSSVRPSTRTAIIGAVAAILWATAPGWWGEIQATAGI